MYEIIDCEQNSEDWIKAKLGVPSASRASEIITSKGERSKSLEKYAYYLAECIVAGFDVNAFYGNESTKYGHETENEAITAYELRFDCDVERVGFCVKKDAEGKVFCGASPDGMVNERKVGIESKSLPKCHSSTLKMYATKGTVPSTRIPQAQMQIFVCDFYYVDNWFYRPGLPSLRYRHEPDQIIQQSLKAHLSELIKIRDEHVLFLREFTFK